AIAWSYDLLTPEQQDLFRSLSVFAGGFALDAVESLTRTHGANHDPFGVLGALVDHSLVQALPQPSGENRFLVLETLREYGVEQLVERGAEADARLTHARWFRQLAEEAEPQLTGSDQEAWLNRLDPEWDNIRAAVNWSLENGREDVALRLLGAIWRFCSTRGHTTESRVLLERALALPGGAKTTFRTRALVAAGNLAQNQRDQAAAQSLFEQARDLAIEIGHPTDEIQALIGLAKVAVNRSDYATAIDFHQRAAALARATGDQCAAGISLGGLAYVAYFQGKLDDAVRYWEEARQVVSALGDNLLESVAVSNLGAVAMVRGEFDRAEGLLSRALELQRRLRDANSLPYTLTNLAETWRQLGDFTLADGMFRESIAAFRDYADAGTAAIVTGSHARLVRAQGDIPRAAAMILDSVQVLTEVGDRHSNVRNAETLAALCVLLQDHAGAAGFLAAATAVREEIGSTLNPVERGEVEEVTRRARRALGEQWFATHWTAGANLDFEALARRMTIVAREISGAPSGCPAAAPPQTPPVEHSLTVREMEVLRLLAQGQSTRDISDALCISPRTTATHVTNILGKLQVTSRTAAVASAMRAGLV
ncbi:MAG: tetratricopeptide repeat protein, partial [Chloroflexota bacterium]|nr:tetratricopeptide repeat protein [Chloroflexota bacterium]